MKWLFFDLGSTLIDESDVLLSRCEYAIKNAGIDRDEFMNKVYEEAKISPTPIKTAAESYGVVLPKWDKSLEKLYEGTPSLLSALHGKYKLGIIANQAPGTQDRMPVFLFRARVDRQRRHVLYDPEKLSFQDLHGLYPFNVRDYLRNVQ